MDLRHSTKPDIASSSSEVRLTQAERTEISDKKMFEATVRLIVDRGPIGTSLKDVGVLAGYSRGLASHRFGNKNNLFSFTLKRLGENWLSQLTKVTAGYTGLQAVERALDQHYQYCVDAPDYVRTFYTLWFEALNADSNLSAAIRSIHKRRQQDVVDWIVADPQIDESIKHKANDIAGQFSASIVGIIYSWLINPDDVQQTKILHDGLKQTMTTILTGA